MMRFLILLALCVAASQARSTNSGSRMKLLSRVLDFLDERDDDSDESAEDCECPTLEGVQAFVASVEAAGSAEGPPERPEGICKLKDCFDPEDVELALGCECPERPESGEEPVMPEGDVCPRFICRSLRDGPPGGRSGPRGGGSRGPPSAEKKRDESYECECRPPPPPGAPPPTGEPDGLPPCPPEDCSGSGPEPEPEDDDKRHARRSHARRQDPEDFESGEICLCPCPPDMECEEDPADAEIPACMPGECDDMPERRKSAPRTRALVNLLKSLLH